METLTELVNALGSAGPLACVVILTCCFILLIHSLMNRALRVIERALRRREKDE